MAKRFFYRYLWSTIFPKVRSASQNRMWADDSPLAGQLWSILMSAVLENFEIQRVDSTTLARDTPQHGIWERDPNIPASLRDILALNDFEPIARGILPRSIFGFVSGGVEDNSSLEQNRAAFKAYAFCPRTLFDVSNRTIETPLLGRVYAAPFGIAPMGGAGMCGLRADAAFARAAAKANIPFILSGASVIPLEQIFRENPAAWFQAYFINGRDNIISLVDRVAAAGYETLVVTVDVPVSGNRENNIRAGYSSPLRPTLRLVFDGMTHPRWLFGTLLRTIWTDGIPLMHNFQAGPGAPVISTKSRPTARRDALCWDDIAAIRARWPRKLVLKGILSGPDAKRAREIGADGVIVSNHGGRQLDGARATLRALPDVVSQAGGMTVMLDSGIRRGTDVLKALALGARFVFVGRPFMYAATVAGESGVSHAIDLLSQEINRDLALLGCTDPLQVTSQHLCSVSS
jgi:L-lactate dehydrogenase (cytochrome)